MGVLINLVGQKFGRLTVVERGKNDKQRNPRWICKCTCGNHVVVRGGDLRFGSTRSCGCLQRECAAKTARWSLTKHGMCGTPTYSSYRAAKKRCQNPNDPSYADYGGRGIKFLYASFEDFLDDLGERPLGTTLERCDNDGHYAAGCCRWANQIEQQNNKRSNRLITAFGRTRTLTRWAREMGISDYNLRNRLRRGLSPEDALTRPVAVRHSSRRHTKPITEPVARTLTQIANTITDGSSR
jgi:hypothetical protein